MMKPYDKILVNQLPRFFSLGFELVSDSKYFAVLVSDAHKIEFSVGGSFIAPVFDVSFFDQQDTRYPMWLVREIIDSDSNEKDMEVLRSIKRSTRIDELKMGSAEYAHAVEKFTNAVIDQSISFLTAKSHLVNLSDKEFREEYDRRFRTVNIPLS